MNYSETVTFLYEQLPVYQKTGQVAYKDSLDNIIELCSLLGNPHTKIKTIHIGGTNGKGSVSHMCASILQEAGYKTGLYTSPHFIDFRERIQINGSYIEKNEITQFVERHHSIIQEIQPSFFEISLALAFDYFARQNVDIAVIEVGLGGRLDSTNIITPLVACITNIGLDHTHILGNTKAQIAGEKAGIIKPSIPIIIGESNEETDFVFREKAKECSSTITFANTIFSIQSDSENEWFTQFNILQNNKIIAEKILSDLSGLYQKKNICTAIAIINEIRTQGFHISQQDIRSGFRKVIQNTHLQGRWHIISEKPLIVCDIAHNHAGTQETMKQVNSLKNKDIHIVWGMVQDKDIETIIPLLPHHAQYYLCKPNIERGMPTEELKQYFAQLKYSTHTSVVDAYTSAYQNIDTESILYIGGSTFVVAEFLSQKT
ncbi:MAG: bifunctional folylpolyglutamate synthase/dihydrofolate synthase [Bacteroidales bacterium]|jgi:dihydrofolate synthase/folylpolyglutamate synthase|nr:bifunctional folylpolyglutamate synthase/dihydrofolate synthase [Bacteroidales bacterium]